MSANQNTEGVQPKMIIPNTYQSVKERVEKMKLTLKNIEEAQPKKVTPNAYQSVEERIQKMKLTFSNAKLPNILAQLQTIGYTEEKLNELLTKVTELETLTLTQKKEYAEQYAETEKFNAKRIEINTLYMKHLALCKVLFKSNTQAGTALGFSGDRKEAYSSWFQQVSGFYAQLLTNAEFLAKVGTINIKRADLEAQQTALADLTTLKENQKKETAEAQQATEIRDKALDNLQPLYNELISYAKILFQDSQSLEALDIVVKR